MSHRWNCPSETDARRKARDDAYMDFEYGHGREYRRAPFDCDDGNRAYKREYEREAYVREEQAEEERRARRRAEERQMEEARQREYWAEEERRHAEEMEEAYRLAAEMEGPTDDGSPPSSEEPPSEEMEAEGDSGAIPALHSQKRSSPSPSGSDEHG